MLDLIIPNELPIVVQPTVVNIFGQTQAELLSRLKYWLKRATKYRDGFLWVYKTVDQWASELNKSVKTIQRAIKDLENKKVLISKQFESKDWYHGKSYRIDLDVLYGLIGIEKPIESKSVEKKRQDVQEVSLDVPIITPNTTISNNVCMDKSENEPVKEEFWDQEEDWSIIKTLGDSRIDPDSNFAMTVTKILREVNANADQLKEVLNIMFNAKFHIKNPFGFIKKVLRDFVSGESVYFNYHYS